MTVSDDSGSKSDDSFFALSLTRSQEYTEDIGQNIYIYKVRAYSIS